MDQEIEIDIPQFFICPISLQIMRDPVIAITGITYDRESIEQWLFTSKNTICPVTKQPLPKDSDLTPNHTLRRLIQAWSSENSSFGIDRIPTPKPCLDKFHFIKLVRDFRLPRLQSKILVELEFLASENDRNRKYMVEAGVPKALLMFIVTCFNNNQINGLEEAVSILRLIRVPPKESKVLLVENDQIIPSLTWVLGCNLDNHVSVKSHAVSVLKTMLEDASSCVLERLKPEFFDMIIDLFRQKNITQQGINAALKVLLNACPWGRNRIMMVESGAVFELIELEWRSPENKTTELILGILFHLCSCADGRAMFLSHKGAIAVVAKRILTVSPTADDRAILILSLISKHSGTNMVLQEMLDVKAVSKLCMMLQADCAGYLKDKARDIIKSHSDEWKNHPCFNVSHLIR
ncbi:plant U-box 24 [Euphorbia peplus]|nr:plant U-box 24 [Euphorbia peplus]